jgi:hypothetical protein
MYPGGGGHVFPNAGGSQGGGGGGGTVSVPIVITLDGEAVYRSVERRQLYRLKTTPTAV